MTVAYSYDRRRVTASARLETKLRQEINQALDKGGMDGNRRFNKVGEGLSRAFDILAKFGIEPDETLNAHNFNGPKGTYLIRVAFTNKEDSFSPTSISNTGLHVQWQELGQGRYEVTAYLS